MFTYPFSYGSNLVDSLYATSFYMGIDHYRIGTRTTIADGYGTLILPSGIYNNLLRVKVIQNFTDSSSTKVTQVFGITYSWYDGVNKTPALSISTLSNTTGGSTTTVKMVHISSVVNGIADNKTLQKAVTLYPNPATDKVTIETSEIPTISQVSIMNLDGKELLHQKITEPNTTIDVSALTSGVYFVRVTGERTVQVGKFIKQ